MSFGASGLVWHHSKASGVDLLVLMAIANYISDDGAFPKVETIAADARTSVRQVYRSLNVLRGLGEIDTERGAGIGKGIYKTSRYWIVLHCPEDCSGDWNHTKKGAEKARGDNLSGLRGDNTSGLEVTHTADKPVIEPVNELLHGHFEEFWAVYPRKSNKGGAKRVFAKALAKCSIEVLVDAARRYRDDPNRIDQFTKHATTWLNNECWDDPALPERTLSAEDKAKMLAEKQARDRQISIELARKEMEESKKAREASTPPPKCEHGSNLLLCIKCLRKGQ